MMTEGLGRIHDPDERDRQFPMADVLSVTTEEDLEAQNRGWRYWWQDGWWGDQARTPQCVAYAWLHWTEDGPTTHAPRQPGRSAAVSPAQGAAVLDPGGLYQRSKNLDPFGPDTDGTTVRAGAKVLREERLIKEFRWANKLEDVINAILVEGPVVAGTYWYHDMSRPDEDAVIRVGGGLAGGHAYLINGVNVHNELFRIKNSWGRSWGNNGTAYITFADFNELLLDQGEACLAIEASTD